MAVAADVAVLRADDEHDEVLVTDARHPPWRRRLDVADAARPQLPHLAADLESSPAAVDEVELVLLVVEVRPADHAGREHDGVHPESRHAELAAHLAKRAVTHLVDRSEGVTHIASNTAVPEQIYLRVMIVLATAVALTACGGGGSKKSKEQSSLEAPFVYDQSKPLDVQNKKTLRQGEVELRDISFKGPNGEGVPAYLVVPAGKGPHPAVIYAHGSAGDRRDLLLYAILLAQKGAVAMALEMNYAAARTTVQPPKGIRGAEAVARNQIQAVVEVRRAVDVLRSLDFVDEERIGYVGWSAGARTGAIVAGVDHRIRAFDLLGGGALPIGASLVGAPANLRPRLTVLLRKTDPLLYVAHAAPSALLFQDGRKDEVVPRNALATLAEAGSKPKEVRWYDSTHAPNAATWDYSFTWLSKQLGLTGKA